MKVSGITILLVGTAAIGANAQVLKGTSSSSYPRLRRKIMKEADRRRLQTTFRAIDCVGIDKSNVDGYGLGCVEQMPILACENNDSTCESNDIGYDTCFLDGAGATNTCVCVIPNPKDPSNKCNGDFASQAKRPCCREG